MYSIYILYIIILNITIISVICGSKKYDNLAALLLPMKTNGADTKSLLKKEQLVRITQQFKTL